MFKYSFSGHDTFYCRNYWLKKGLDHLWNGQIFNDQAVVSLGVGKNMVSSIYYWLKAFGLLTSEGKVEKLAEQIFQDDGYDPFCEDIGTIWLLHYMLVTTGISATYHLVFNEFRKQRLEFNRDQLLAYLERRCRTADVNYSQNSIKKDINVFFNNYTTPEKSKGLEEDFSGLLYELDLIQKIDKFGRNQTYKIENKARPELSAEIVLFLILKNRKGNSISFNELLNGTNSVGSVFALSPNGLMDKIEQMLKKYKRYLVFSDDGGIRELQIKKELTPWTVLNNYYGI